MRKKTKIENPEIDIPEEIPERYGLRKRKPVTYDEKKP